MINRRAAKPLAWAAGVAVAGLTGRMADAAGSKLTTTPGYVQDGFGPAGDQLPYGGQEFCFPTSFAMSLSYLGAYGFNQVGPAAPTMADGLNLDRVMSGLMQTDPLAGTQGDNLVVNAVTTYLNAKGIASSNFTVATYQAPTMAQLAGLDQPGTTVNLELGYYNPSGNSYVRNGGHGIVLVGQAVNAQGQSSPSTVVVDNPLPGALAPASDVPANTLEYLNTAATTGSLTSDGSLYLDTGQFPGFWGTTRTVIERAFAVTINTSQLSANHPASAAWSPAAGQSVNPDGGTFTVAAPVQGTGGLSLTQPGTVELQSGDTATGTNTVAYGTLRGDAATAQPFGSGTTILSAATLQWVPAYTGGATSQAVAGGSAAQVTYANGCTLAINRDGNPSATLTVGGSFDGSTANLTRIGTGTLIVAPAGGLAGLGSTERVLVAGSGTSLPTVTNGIVAPSIVAADAGPAAAGTFVTYGFSTGFAPCAAYTQSTAVAVTNVPSTAVYDVTDTQTVPGLGIANAYAVRVSGALTGAAYSTIKVGPQTSGGQAGVILNGGTISTTALAFGPAEGLVYTGGAGGTISAIVQGTGGLTTFGPGTLSLTAANQYTGTTNVNGGVLRAASTTGSATGTGPVNVRPNGTLQVAGTAGGGLTSVYAGGTLQLSYGGGTLAGPLTLYPGAYLLGQGTVTGTADVNGTIGSPATDLGTAATPYAGAEYLTFTGAASFTDATYAWRLNALDDAAADAGVSYSQLRFPGPNTAVNLGEQNDPVRVTLDLSGNVPDPNTDTPFWMAAHQWDVAASGSGFNNLWYDYSFPTYADGFFSVSNDASLHNMYLNYTPTGSTWAGGGAGTWTAAGHWSGYVPDSTNAIATFPAAAAAQVVTLDAPQTAGTLNFNSVAGTTIAGTSTLTLSRSGGQATIDVTAGTTNTLAVPVSLTNGLAVTAAAGTGLTVAGPVTGTGFLSANGPGTLTVAAVSSLLNVPLVANGPVVFAGRGPAGGGPLVQVVPSVAIFGGGSVSLANAAAGNANQRTLLVTYGLSFAGGQGSWAGTLDLADNDLDVPNGSLATITSQAAQGFAGGSWNGIGGIVSSTAAADPRHLTAVGVIQNATAVGGATPIYTSFDGQPVSATDVLARYTYYGDTNLDGVVNAADYTRVDAGFVTHLTGWQNGDFNYDGTVDGTDYALMDNAFDQQGGGIGSPAAAVAAPAVAVPEPAELGLGAAAVGAIASRRRRPRGRPTPGC